MLQEQPRLKPAGLAIAELDAAEWDVFASRHPDGHLLQAAGWGELKGRFGWEVRRITVLGPEGAQAGAQVLIRRRLGLSAVYVPRGPLFAPDAPANGALLAALDRLARHNRAVFLRLEPNMLENDPHAATLHSELLVKGFRPSQPIQPRSSIHLSLAPDPARQLAAMRKGHRADIRRAAREGVGVRLGAGAADLDAFYTIMEQTGTRAGFGIHSREYYRSAWAQFAPDGAGLFLAEQGEQTLAACLIFAWAGTGLYLYGGSTAEGLKSGANHALQWQAIQWGRERGCTRYDFWGVPDQFGQASAATDDAERARLEEAAKDDPLYGVFRFKKGFGGEVVRYLPAYDRVYLPPLYTIWQRRFGA
jgi:lipid II:glycine glycyltransferase (peptidoglycan interpeptide bridge formation enzyme)